MKKIKYRPFVPLALLLCFTAAVIAACFKYVDLRPKVDENIFFSSDDPQFQDEKKIAKMFSYVPQLIFAAKGPITKKEYAESVDVLSTVFEEMPEVLSVQSLARGPEDIKDAIASPLWKRTIVSKDRKSTLLFVFLKDNPDSETIQRFEKIRDVFTRPGFEITISGAPYIVELIRRNLYRDLKVFSIAAFSVFSLALLVIFGSLWIVAGVIAACANASAVTLLAARLLEIEMGFLTANLPMIVFVLTLSHIAFLTADWKHRIVSEGENKPGLGWKAAGSTFTAALWSTLTALLGFLVLLFVPAKSLKQLGIAGSLGTILALAAAYIVYPWFLDHQKKSPKFLEFAKNKRSAAGSFFTRRHPFILAFLGVLAVCSAIALPRLNTDPSLFAYFKKGGTLRTGLEYIDKNGGSNPLSIVIEDPESGALDDRASYKKMWKLHTALEKDSSLGHVVSLPILLAEAKRNLIARFMSNKWLLDILESKRFDEVARYFVTPERRRALFLLRMKESELDGSRVEIIERIKKTVEENGYKAELVGGVFMLQGRLSELVASSLISGSALLNGVILIVTLVISRSLRTSLAMLASLYFVPITMLGILSFLGMPLDVIAAPAANVAIGMGVDSMIHLMVNARRQGPLSERESWNAACCHLWEPIFWSTLIVAAGFSIFLFSNFPPTQRFGFSVVLGTLISPPATLFIFPWLATLKLPLRRKAAPVKGEPL